MSLAGRRIDHVLILILLVALVVRVRLGVTREYIHDEINTAIPLSKTISFEPGHLNLPCAGRIIRRCRRMSSRRAAPCSARPVWDTAGCTSCSGC